MVGKDLPASPAIWRMGVSQLLLHHSRLCTCVQSWRGPGCTWQHCTHTARQTRAKPGRKWAAVGQSRPGSQKAWARVPWLPSLVTLGKSLTVCRPQFLHWLTMDNNRVSCSCGLLSGLNELIHVRCFESVRLLVNIQQVSLCCHRHHPRALPTQGSH